MWDPHHEVPVYWINAINDLVDSFLLTVEALYQRERRPALNTKEEWGSREITISYSIVVSPLNRFLLHFIISSDSHVYVILFRK